MTLNDCLGGLAVQLGGAVRASKYNAEAVFVLKQKIFDLIRAANNLYPLPGTAWKSPNPSRNV
jgi:hypothetical protein